MGERLGVLVVGLVLGFGVGWWMAPREASTAATAAPPAAESKRAMVPDAPDPRPVDRAEPTRPRAGDDDMAATVARLRGENRALTSRLAVAAGKANRAEDKAEQAAADVAEHEGSAVPEPDDLPERFTEDALAGSFRAAFESTGLPGQIEAVDCSEFPCILFGRLELGVTGNDSRLRGLLGAVRSDYEGDSINVGKSTYRGADGSHMRFSASYYPSDLSEDVRKALQKRVRYRRRQFGDAPQ